MSGTKKLNYPMLASFFINGMIAVITGIILKYIYVSTGIGYGKIGFSVSVQAIFNMFGGLATGFLINRYGRKFTLALFCVLFSLFGSLAFLTSFPLILCVMALTGFGWGICNNIIHLMLIESSGRSSSSISTLHTSYAVGSFFGPFLITFFTLNNLSWKFPALLVSVCSIFLIPFLLKIPSKTRPDQIEEPSTSVQPDKTAVCDSEITASSLGKGFFLCIALYFLYVGTEISMNSWIPVFLEFHRNFEPAYAQLAISVLWLVIIFSRLGCILIRKKYSNASILAVQCSGVFFSLMLFIFSNGYVMTFISIIILGISMGGLSPSNAENAKKYLTNSTTSGIIFTGSGLGSMSLPLLAGYITGTSSIFYGMISIIIFSFVTMAAGLINLRIRKHDTL